MKRIRIKWFHLPALLRKALQAGCFVIILLAFVLVIPVFAQRELEDYKYQYEKYREFYAAYIQARSEYLKYQTLTSTQTAIQATQDFLYSRAIVLRTYLQTLKYDLRNAPAIDSAQRTTLVLALDGEVSWLTDLENQTRALTNPTLNDLLELSLRFEKKEFNFRKIADQALGNILIGKLKSLQAESTAINFLLAEKIEKNGQGKDTTTLKQWLETVNDKTYRSQKNIENAQNYLQALNKAAREKEMTDSYGKLKKELEQGKLLLTETIKYQREIFGEVGQ